MTEAMWQALRVNRFLRVQDLASDFVLRGGEARMDDVQGLQFQRYVPWAKARAGQQSAAADYGAIADLAIGLLISQQDLPPSDDVYDEAKSLLDNILDRENSPVAERLIDALWKREPSLDLWTRLARLRHRQGKCAAAAIMIGQVRTMDWLDERQRTALLVQ